MTTLQEVIVDESLWVNEDWPLKGLWFLDTYRKVLDPVPIYSVCAPVKEVREWQEIIKSNELERGSMQVSYYQGYPIPIDGVYLFEKELPNYDPLNDPVATEEQIGAVKQFVSSEKYQIEIQKWLEKYE